MSTHTCTLIYQESHISPGNDLKSDLIPESFIKCNCKNWGREGAMSLFPEARLAGWTWCEPYLPAPDIKNHSTRWIIALLQPSSPPSGFGSVMMLKWFLHPPTTNGSVLHLFLNCHSSAFLLYFLMYSKPAIAKGDFKRKQLPDD